METEEQRKPVVIRRNPPVRTKEQKAGFVFILVAGSCAIILGALYLGKHLNSPFDLRYEGPRFLTQAERQAEEVEKQKTQDVDGDGLTDYDELYLYRTSPYLYDTDGDGLPDPVEIQSGTDPNCAGSSCAESELNQETRSALDLTEIGETALTAQSAVSSPVFTGFTALDTEAGATANVENLSAAEVRELLLLYGATSEQINDLSDEQVMTLYKTALQEIQSSSENP